MKRYRWTTTLAGTISGAITAGVTGALMPTSPTHWAIREGLAWLAGGLTAAAFLARTER